MIGPYRWPPERRRRVPISRRGSAELRYRSRAEIFAVFQEVGVFICAEVGRASPPLRAHSEDSARLYLSDRCRRQRQCARTEAADHSLRWASVCGKRVRVYSRCVEGFSAKTNLLTAAAAEAPEVRSGEIRSRRPRAAAPSTGPCGTFGPGRKANCPSRRGTCSRC